MHRNIPEPLGGDHHTTVAHRGIQIGFATSRNPVTWQRCPVSLARRAGAVKQRLQRGNIKNRVINSIPRYTLAYAAISQRLVARCPGPARLRWRWSRAESTFWVLRDVA